jgi:hypothetical protein
LPISTTSTDTQFPFTQYLNPFMQIAQNSTVNAN